MNRNGYSGIGRVTVATTSSSVTPADHLPWFPSTAAGDGSSPRSIGRRSPPLHPTGITTTTHSRRLSSRTSLALSPADSLHSVHAAAPPHLEMQSVLNSSQSSIGSLFRPPLTVADPAPRIYHNTQYGGSLYTTANTTIASFSSLYSIHGQPASHMTSGGVSPYNAFYPQYPQGYSHGCLLSPAGHYPHIDSYSAVLASMGSHAQHVSQSQLPRTFMPTHISQYSPLSSHRTATPTTSPTSSGSIRHSPNQQVLMHRHSPKSEQIRDSLAEATVVVAEGYGQPPHGLSTKEEKSHSTSQHMQSRQLSPLSTHNKSGSVLKEPSIKSDLNKDMGYKLPSGKEGSLKHRILTRPSNSQINECPSSGPEQILSAGSKGYAKSDAISPAKRSKSISEMASSDSETGCGQSQSQCTGPAPQGIPNVPMIPHLHYPPHFMKGSIIQLANGDLKRVEDLQTDDFVHSAEISADLKIDSSTVVRTDENIERGTSILSFLVGENKVQVTVEATLEHPFFVFGQGWSSCCPQRTIKRYGLDCHKLSVGDVCISLTHKEVRRDTNQLHYQQIPKGTKIDGEYHPATNTTSTSPMLTDNNSFKPSAHLSRHRSPPAAMGLYRRKTNTHSTETQTNLAPADNNNNSSSSSGSNESSDRSVGHPVRKRRWSAPGKMNIDSLPDFGRSSSPLVETNETEIQRQTNN